MDNNIHLRVELSTAYQVTGGCSFYFHILNEPLYFPYLKTFFDFLFELGYCDAGWGEVTGYSSNWKVDNCISIRDDGVYLADHWQEEYCTNGGVKKSPFAKMQFLLYELKEFHELGLFNFEIWHNESRLEPIWPPMRARGTKTTKKLIKEFKKRISYRLPKRIAELNKCNLYTLNREAGYIAPCCVCLHEELRILKKA